MSHKHHRSHDLIDSELWQVDVKFEQHGHEIVAIADLFVGSATYEAHGSTHTGELDAAVARQLAVARALSGLAHQLVDDASRSVGRVARAVACATDEAADAYISLE